MEQDSSQPQNPPAAQPQVSFPQPRQEEGGSKTAKIIIAIVGVIIIVVVGGWFILGNSSGGSVNPSPTPNDGLSAFPTPEITASPSPSPTPLASPVDRSSISIEVLNGTGVPGEASYLQGQLKDLGYSKVTAANADTQDSTETVATFSRDLDQSVVDEITAKLQEIYDNVHTRRATVTGGYDLSVTTGPRKGGSSASASPKASPAPTASSGN